MRPPLRQALNTELAQARAAQSSGDFAAAFAHLERAHVLSQRHALAHAGVHLRMLGWGLAAGQPGEVLGQLPRILAALLFSRIWVPSGNTGGSRVSAFQPMPIPADLAQILAQDR